MTTYPNPFVRDVKDYKRDIDVVAQYIRDQSLYISKVTGRPLDYCERWVRTQFRKGGKLEFKDREMGFLERGASGDRTATAGGFYSYIRDCAKEGNIMAPTMTVYTNPKKEQSFLVEYIRNNIAARSKAKKEMFAAEMDGDLVKMAFKKDEQNNAKIANNSISGAHVSASTPLYNKTGHSSLTSNCRVTSGYGNLNNEKMLSGNRHYWNLDIVLENILAIIQHCDLTLVEAAVNRHGLVYPTPEQTMECIKYSTDLYLSGSCGFEHIEELVTNLTPVERAAFCYVGDLYTMAKLNDGFFRKWLGSMASRSNTPHPDPHGVYKCVSEDVVNLVAQIWTDVVKGRKHKDYAKEDYYACMASTAVNIMSEVSDKQDLIIAFLRTDVMPHDIASLPGSLRRSALVSDTDSTIFTVQDWVQWFCGSLKFTVEANAISQVLVFFSVTTIVHLLAKMSANMGVAEEFIFTTAMKNEYRFDAFVPTPITKHYYAAIGSQEGFIKPELEMQIKGVHLRSSNVPDVIRDLAAKWMQEICEDSIAGKQYTTREVLEKVATIELALRREIASGDPKYFASTQIKTPGHYNNVPERTPHFYHELWQSCFSQKYGEAPPPPYSAIRINTTLDKPAALKKWLNGLEDRALADRLTTFLARYNRDNLGSLQLSVETIHRCGIPKELSEVIDYRKMIGQTCAMFHHILQTLGLYVNTERYIVSDTIVPSGEIPLLSEL